jgi:hypothetical protein
MRVYIKNGLALTPLVGVAKTIEKYYQGMGGKWVESDTVQEGTVELLPMWAKHVEIDGVKLAQGTLLGLPSPDFPDQYDPSVRSLADYCSEKKQLNQGLSDDNLTLLKALLASNPDSAKTVSELYSSYTTAVALGLNKAELISLATSFKNGVPSGNPAKNTLDSIIANLNQLWEMP